MAGYGFLGQERPLSDQERDIVAQAAAERAVHVDGVFRWLQRRDELRIAQAAALSRLQELQRAQGEASRRAAGTEQFVSANERAKHTPSPEALARLHFKLEAEGEPGNSFGLPPVPLDDEEGSNN